MFWPLQVAAEHAILTSELKAIQQMSQPVTASLPAQGGVQQQ